LKIALDIDGVLADITIPWVNICNELHNTHLVKQDVKTWNFWKIAGISQDEFFRIFSLAWREWKQVPPTEPDLATKVKDIQRHGQVDIVTGRSEDTIPFVKKWLIHHQISYSHFISVVRGEDKILLDYDVFIDDAPINVVRAANLKKRVILYNQPWNHKVPDSPWVRRATSFEEVLCLVEEIKRRLKE